MIIVVIVDYFASLMVFLRKFILICRFVNEIFEYRQENDFDIELDVLFADVFKVEFDAFFYFFQRVGFVALVVNLRLVGNVRFYFMAQYVVFNELSILFVMRYCVRTWIDNRYFFGQYIDKLR